MANTSFRSFLFPKPRVFLLRIAVLAAFFPLAGWLGGSRWQLDLLNHFQLQYAAVLAVCTAVLLGLKAWRLAVPAGLLLMFPLARIAPLLLPSPAPPPDAAPLRCATFNVLTANTRRAETVEWIRATDPDLVFLPEVNEEWAAALAPLKESHPHFIDFPVEGNFGFAFYSKLPLLSREIIPCGKLGLPLLKARLQGPGGEFTFLGAHPVPPGNAFWAAERDDFLRVIAEQVRPENGPVLVAGDLNATPWSHAMKPLADAGLRGHSVSPTWMRGNPVLAIPIDHVLYRGPRDRPETAACRTRWTGPDLGSDHRPVVAEISW